MQKILKRLIFPILAGALLVGCETTGTGVGLTTGKDAEPRAPIVPLIDVAERKAELAAVPSNQRGRWCKKTWPTPNLERRATIAGPIEYQQSNAQRAGNALFGLVEAYYAGRDRAAKDIRAALAKGAQIDAFTVLVGYSPREFRNYNRMNEPVFQVANFMVALAHAYLILKSEFPEDRQLLADVGGWGDQLFDITRRANGDFTDRYRGIDRRAHIAAGWASWGNAAANRAALASAYRYYRHALAGTGKDGVDLVWVNVPRTGGTRLSFVNATLQSALVAAHALHRSGAIDVYTVAPRGGTLVEGLAWLWNEIDETRPVEIVASPRHEGSKSIAWAELFVHEFPDHPTAKRMDEWLSRKGALHVNMGGGPTTCLYRSVAPAS